MRLIKMYAWEESFLSRILEIRSQEIKELFKPSMLMSCTLTVSPSISILAGFGTTMVMTLAGVELSTTQAFTVMSVFSALQVCLQSQQMELKFILLQFSISTLPWAIRQVAEANVGFRRLQQFLGIQQFSSRQEENSISFLTFRASRIQKSYKIFQFGKSKPVCGDERHLLQLGSSERKGDKEKGKKEGG